MSPSIRRARWRRARASRAGVALHARRAPPVADARLRSASSVADARPSVHDSCSLCGFFGEKKTKRIILSSENDLDLPGPSRHREIALALLSARFLSFFLAWPIFRSSSDSEYRMTHSPWSMIFICREKPELCRRRTWPTVRTSSPSSATMEPEWSR